VVSGSYGGHYFGGSILQVNHAAERKVPVDPALQDYVRELQVIIL